MPVNELRPTVLASTEFVSQYVSLKDLQSANKQANTLDKGGHTLLSLPDSVLQFFGFDFLANNLPSGTVSDIESEPAKTPDYQIWNNKIVPLLLVGASVSSILGAPLWIPVALFSVGVLIRISTTLLAPSVTIRTEGRREIAGQALNPVASGLRKKILETRATHILNVTNTGQARTKANTVKTVRFQEGLRG